MAVGDLVWWNEGRCLGYVQIIVETPEDLHLWGIEGTQGQAMIANHHPFDPNAMGFVRHDRECLAREGVAKLSKREIQLFQKAIQLAKPSSRYGFDDHGFSVMVKYRAGARFEWVFRLYDRNLLMEEIAVLETSVQG